MRRRDVKDGIKLRAQTGDVGETWWADKWIRVLESFGWQSRLDRGKNYARAGQVMEYEIRPGKIAAKVQGSRRKPYQIRIRVRQLDAGTWNRVTRALSSRAVFAAKLLAGEMPREVEDAFRSTGASLFPRSRNDLKMTCSCPDVATPCKHIAAVYYVVGEAFDRDPWLMFELRGRTRDQLMSMLRGARPQLRGAPVKEVIRPIDPEDFWGEPPDVEVKVRPPGAPMAILKRLGAPAFWTGTTDFWTEMQKVYFSASRRAIDIAYALG
ncbi:MAG: SWIM zinc finger family protein [Planctomycetes bacterium]|nr:SWIM zinc finger family protein [Planctomycetota bacterium]